MSKSALLESVAFSNLYLDDEMTARVKQMRAAGCKVNYDPAAGTVIAYANHECCLRGVRKGAQGQPWIVRHYNTEAIKWKRD